MGYALIKWLIPDRNNVRVSECEATHCNNANALQTLLDPCPVKVAGVNNG